MKEKLKELGAECIAKRDENGNLIPLGSIDSLLDVCGEKTGHWIEHERNGIKHIECSKCSVWFLRSHLVHNSYCPNCGQPKTKMEEVEE